VPVSITSATWGSACRFAEAFRAPAGAFPALATDSPRPENAPVTRCNPAAAPGSEKPGTTGRADRK
jgi:hypothetical protein